MPAALGSLRMEEKNTPDQMISLTAASALVYHAATNTVTDDTTTLNNIAHVIGARTRLFSRGDDSEAFALVWPAELFEGVMEDGGKCLRFTDGRPTLRNLSILKRDLPQLIEELRKLFGPRST